MAKKSGSAIPLHRLHYGPCVFELLRALYGTARWEYFLRKPIGATCQFLGCLKPRRSANAYLRGRHNDQQFVIEALVYTIVAMFLYLGRPL